MSIAHRNQKSESRRQAALDLDVRWAYYTQRTPLYAESVSSCSCGWASWLMPGASDDDVTAFTEAHADHDALCEVSA